MKIPEILSYDKSRTLSELEDIFESISIYCLCADNSDDMQPYLENCSSLQYVVCKTSDYFTIDNLISKKSLNLRIIHVGDYDIISNRLLMRIQEPYDVDNILCTLLNDKKRDKFILSALDIGFMSTGSPTKEDYND